MFPGKVPAGGGVTPRRMEIWRNQNVFRRTRFIVFWQTDDDIGRTRMSSDGAFHIVSLAKADDMAANRIKPAEVFAKMLRRTRTRRTQRTYKTRNNNTNCQSNEDRSTHFFYTFLYVQSPFSSKSSTSLSLATKLVMVLAWTRSLNTITCKRQYNLK